MSNLQVAYAATSSLSKYKLIHQSENQSYSSTWHVTCLVLVASSTSKHHTMRSKNLKKVKSEETKLFRTCLDKFELIWTFTLKFFFEKSLPNCFTFLAFLEPCVSIYPWASTCEKHHEKSYLIPSSHQRVLFKGDFFSFSNIVKNLCLVHTILLMHTYW